MKTYIGTKIVNAEPMTSGVAQEKGYKTQKNMSMYANGYVVEYPDGYKSWSPKETFEAAHREVSSSEKKLIK